MRNFISDAYIMTWRNLMRYFRLPQLVFFSTFQPVMFVLLFNYVFGSTINVPGVSYTNYLLPGILVQTVLMGSIQTGIALAEDLSRGMINRFRSLPMSPMAVLLGRTLADAFRNIFVIILITIVGYIIGYRFDGDLLHAGMAFLLALLFGFAFSWISATIGLFVKSAEAAQVASFIWVFPLAFISSIFVPIQGMTEVLKTFATYSPVTATVDAVRAFSLGNPAGDAPLVAIEWIVLILMVFVQLATWQYKKITS